MNFDTLVSSLANRLCAADQAVIALSGGVDSGLVAAAVHAACARCDHPVRSVAVTIHSELTAGRDVERAGEVARHIGINHHVIDARMLDIDVVRRNGPDRCYHCKDAIFALLRRDWGAGCLLMDGTNGDDDPARPGLRAAAEYGVYHPLRQLGIAKARVRELARAAGLPNHDAPSESCLATRLAPGTMLTAGRLDMVRRMEGFWHERGVRTLRARHDDTVATVKYHRQYSETIKKNRDLFSRMIKGIGLVSCRFEEWKR
jgi:uncharacterized protein